MTATDNPYVVVRDILLSDAEIIGLVERRVRKRVRRQKDAFPVIVVQRVSEPREFCSAGPMNFDRPVMQIAFWSRDEDEADKGGRAVVRTLDAAGFRAAYAEGISDDVEAAADGSEEHLHVVRVEAELWIYHEVSR